eukprot:TRINITY_DN1576_c0_g1_i1.p1 TRINITY_DN1576_c0_g1~~TRINITY_DN1576_c0_g1_i1.p1  ORF type:complete len:1421 (-),score=622.22 TRINITY_DN1576_c0_g1_i1:141-4403(-)
MHGSIAAKGSASFKVTYSPSATGQYSAEVFEVLTPGGNSVQVQCVGTAIGPRVTLSVASIDFGSVTAGTVVSKVLTISNQSYDPATVQFLTEPNGVFKFDLPHSEATVRHLSSLDVKVSFVAQEPMNYYKRVYMLVANEEPRHIDLLGTCYNSQRRPPDFHQRHVDRWFKRAALGLSRYPPEKLETLTIDEEEEAAPEDTNDTVAKKGAPSAGALTMLVSQSLNFGLGGLAVGSKHQTATGTGVTTEQICAEILTDSTQQEEVYLREPYIDFGACARTSRADYQSVNVTNTTQGKITCVWVTPTDSKGNVIFSVIPPVADISPNEEFKFSVSFTPALDNQFYGQRLECFAYYKTMRNFRLVTEKSITAPWCLTTYVAGHTFPAGQEQFLPQAETSVPLVQFPATHINTPVYQTIKLANKGDTPVKFDFTESGSDGITFTPSRGVLQANQYQLILFKFLPTEARSYKHVFQCMLNNNPESLIRLPAIGQGAVPELHVENAGRLYFKPTCVGASSVRTLMIKNPSPIPVTFKWEIPERHRPYLRIEQPSGMLKGHHKHPLQVQFTPGKAKEYEMRIECTVASTGLPMTVEPVRRKVPLLIRGEGTEGEIFLTPESLSFDNVLVGSEQVKQLVLTNRSNCYVGYAMELREEVGDGDEEDDEDEFEMTISSGGNSATPSRKPAYTVEPASGIIPASSTQLISVTFVPRRKTYYSLSLKCKMNLDFENAHLSRTITPDSLIAARCQILGVGTYPTFAIADVRSDDVPTPLLWRQLGIDRLNVELASTLTLAEHKLAKTGGLLKHSETVSDLKLFTLDFGTGTVRSATTTVFYMLENTSNLPADFSFHFISANEVEMDHWVDLGEGDDYEKKQRFIMEAQLFNIQPRSGRLGVGESAKVKFSYRHTDVDSHETPVLLQIKDGKRIRLLLKGRTAEFSQRTLDFPARTHFLKPIPIGTVQPSVQIVEAFNRGAMETSYEVDLAPLAELQRENFDFPVLQCLNPRGVVSPGEALPLRFVFTPVEDKAYSVVVPVIVKGGETIPVTINGRGFHPQIRMLEELGQEFDTLNFPPVQKLLLDKQCVRLSSEQVGFGDVPVYSSNCTVVTLRNDSPTSVASFAWNTDAYVQRASEALSVSPASGTLQPGDHVICKITFDAGESPLVLSADLACVITNETEKTRWEKEMPTFNEDEFDFEITEELPTNAKNGGARSGMPALDTAALLRSQTLPSAAMKSTFRRRNNNHHNVLFVYIQARVWTLPQYNDSRADIERFFSLDAPVAFLPSRDEVAKVGPSTFPAARDVIRGLLQEIVHDGDVARAIKQIQAEPAPLFAQIVPQPQRSSSRPSNREAEALMQYNRSKNELFNNAGFNELIEEVIEETIFNLASEATHNEFSLTDVPLQVSQGPLKDQRPPSVMSRHVKFQAGATTS